MSRGEVLIRFRILGGLELYDASGAELRSVLSQPKRLALLAYLAASPARRFHSRETLLGLFWPELDEAHARAALSQAVYFLRRALGADAVVSRGHEEIAVDPDRLWCDAAAFDLSLEQGGTAQALELYRGDLLPGFFLQDALEWERWVDSERSRLRSRAAEAAWTLAEVAVTEGRAAEAEHWGRRALSLAGDDETHLRRLIALLDRVGDRAAAVRAYEEFATRLRRDYELEVSPETQELIAELRSRDKAFGRVNAPQPSPTADAAGSPGESPAFQGDLEDENRRSGRRRPLLIGGMAAGIAVLAVGFSILWPRLETRTVPATPSDATSTYRLAVLPLANFGPDPEDAYIADGMTEELISRLSMLSGLRVMARTSVMPYRNGDKSIADVGRELGVAYVLEGSVRRSGDRVRIAVQLIDAGTQQHVWAENYDAEIEDVLDVQRQIAERVAAALPIRPGTMESRRLAERGTTDPEAHLLYLRGRYVLSQDDPASFARARDYFEAALERDPAYARAWSGMADAFDRLAWARAVPSSEAYPRARAAAERALELDPDLAEAHASLARALTGYYWDSEAAEVHFRQAIALDPSNAEAHRAYAAHLQAHGRLEEARTETERALELDPLSFFPHFQMVILLFFEGRYDEAIDRAERLTGIGSDYPMVHFILAKTRLQKGQFEAALRDLDRFDPGRSLPRTLAARGQILGLMGRHDEAREMLRALDDLPGDAPVAFDRAIVHLGLGEKDRALDLLAQAIEERDWRVRLFKQEPEFEALRSEPRFAVLLERAGFTERSAASASP